MRLPLLPPGRQTRTRVENIFVELRRDVPNQEKRAARHNAWISEVTWRLINETVSARREPGIYQALIRQMGRAIRAELKDERRRWADTAGDDVERLLTGDPPLP